jgi:hypothetical protein
MTDASTQSISVHQVSAGGNVYLRVSQGCEHGAHVSTPTDAATLVKQVSADDGNPVALVIHPKTPNFDITIRQPDGHANTVTVRLG